MPTLLIATTNQNKLREYAAIFAGLPFELRTLRDLGIDDDVEETGATFAENARLKAEFYAARSGLPALAFGGSIYSGTPANRLLIVNGQLMHEGESLGPGVTLEQIKPKAAVLVIRGQRFEIGL